MKGNSGKKCHQFAMEVEAYLDRHPGPAPVAVPSQLAAHAGECTTCAEAWTQAAASRTLLSHLAEAPVSEDTTYLATRVRALIADRERRYLPVAWKEMAVAAVLFAFTLGSFVYNIRRTESPNIDEAIALDVPHLNPQHPSDDHQRPGRADVMLTLMQP